MENEINLLNVLVKLIKNRWLIIKIVLSITLASLFLSFILPKTYKSTVRFLPPPRQGSSISGLFSNLIQPSVRATQVKAEAILVILRSRTLEQEVIEKFHLDKVYSTDIPEFLIKKLEANININEIREGGFGFNPLIAIEFSFFDKDPNRAEKVAKFFIFKLDSILKKLNGERSELIFEIMQKRYQQNLVDMQDAQENFRKFQEENGIFEIETQIKSLITQLADLKAQIVQKEIEIAILQNSISVGNNQLLELKVQKRAISKKVEELTMASEQLKRGNIFQPLGNYPALMQKYAVLYRDVSVQNKIYEVIFPQYEEARLNLQIQTQGIQILDPANIPTYKDKPKRLYVVLAGFVFSFLLSLFIVFVKESIEVEREKDSDNYQKIKFIIRSIQKDVPFIKKR